MSKSILIVDTPKNCPDCQLMVDGWCYGIPSREEVQGKIKYLKRPSWCPLRPLPKWKIDGCSAFNERGGIVYDDEVFDFVKELIE